MATIVGDAHDPAAAASQQAWTEALWSVLSPRASGVYVNFLDDEGPERVREAYPPAAFERLVAIKREYDPTNFLRLDQNINPAA